MDQLDLSTALEAFKNRPDTGLQLLADIVITCASQDGANGEPLTTRNQAEETAMAFLQSLDKLFTAGRVWGTPNQQLDTSVWTTVSEALKAVYQMDNDNIIAAVLGFWEAASQILLPSTGMANMSAVLPPTPTTAYGSSSDETCIALQQHLMKKRAVLVPYLLLMQQFATTCGINALQGFSLEQLLVLHAAVCVLAADDKQAELACHCIMQIARPAAAGRAAQWRHEHADVHATQQAPRSQQGQCRRVSCSHSMPAGLDDAEGVHEAFKADEHEDEVDAPPFVWSYLLMLQLVQDPSLDNVKWTTGVGRRIEQTSHIFLAALGGLDDMYAGCTLATLEHINDLTAASSDRRDALKESAAFKRLASMLAACPALPNIIQAIMAKHGIDRKLGLQVLDMVRMLLSEHTQALVTVCCNLLTPESNCSVDIRAEVLQVIKFEVDNYLCDLPEQDDELHAQLWQPQAVNAVLATLMHDPSIKVRRLAARVVALIALPDGNELAKKLIATLAYKMRDKDLVTRMRALELLVQLPVGMLSDVITSQHWAWIIEQCLSQLASNDVSEKFKANAIKMMRSLLSMPNDGKALVGHPVQFMLTRFSENTQQLQDAMVFFPSCA